MNGPTEYELWRDALMIAATSALAWPDETSLRTLALETRTLLREGVQGYRFEDQVRDLTRENLALGSQIGAALSIHRPCHSVHPWKSPEDACERSHYEYADGAECIGCGYDSNDQPTSWPCATAAALGATR